MKNLFVIMSFLLIGLWACTETPKTNQTSEVKTETSTTEAKAEVKTDTTNHVHTFACPMHPEVTGKEGDKCPKCGMALEHKK